MILLNRFSKPTNQSQTLTNNHLNRNKAYNNGQAANNPREGNQHRQGGARGRTERPATDRDPQAPMGRNSSPQAGKGRTDIAGQRTIQQLAINKLIAPNTS